MILRQLLETIKYSNESTDGHSSQYNGVVKAVDGDKVVGTLEYTEYKDDVTISMVEVDKEYRGQKIGFNLIKELAKIYPYTRIIRKNLTADGEKLYKSTEKYFAPFIKKGVDEWGKSLLFKKYLEDDVGSYSKLELADILNSWNNESIKIDDLDFFENLKNITDLLDKNKVKYLKGSEITIEVNDKLVPILEMYGNDFKGVKPNLMNDYQDFCEILINKLRD